MTRRQRLVKALTTTTIFFASWVAFGLWLGHDPLGKGAVATLSATVSFAVLSCWIALRSSS